MREGPSHRPPEGHTGAPSFPGGRRGTWSRLQPQPSGGAGPWRPRGSGSQAPGLVVLAPGRARPRTGRPGLRLCSGESKPERLDLVECAGRPRASACRPAPSGPVGPSSPALPLGSSRTLAFVCVVLARCITLSPARSTTGRKSRRGVRSRRS